jgi:lipopolysaccharide export LptBFGC system permease protein LptF
MSETTNFTNRRAPGAFGKVTSIPVKIPRIYARRYLFGILLQLVLILLFVEAILLAEKLNDVLRAALDRQAHFSDILLLLLFTAPAVFDLALPLALMIAVYRIVLRRREDRELLVLSGAGIGSTRFVWWAMAVGFAAQLISLMVSGAIEPRAKFAERSLLFAAQYDALRGGIAAGQFYFFGKNTVYASPQDKKSSDRPLFIFQGDVNENSSDRVIDANHARLVGPDRDGNLTLLLRDFTTLDYDYSRGGGHPVVQSGSSRIGQYDQELSLDQLLRFDPRGASIGERTSVELVKSSLAQGNADVPNATEAGRRFARSLLCLIAPLIAGLALAFTNQATRSFALPAACGVLMSLDLGASALVENQARAGLLVAVGTLLVVAFVVIGTLMYQLITRQHAIVMPALARA